MFEDGYEGDPCGGTRRKEDIGSMAGGAEKEWKCRELWMGGTKGGAFVDRCVFL